MSIPDHPVIRNMELTGYPDGKYPVWPACPICEGETDLFYLDINQDIVGCDNCISTKDAWEYEKE